jgi:hypothetical protein
VAISEKDGSFAIKNLPVGKWTFRLWHERARWLGQVMLDDRRQNLAKGNLELEIKPGQNNLGMIRIERRTLTRRFQR